MYLLTYSAFWLLLSPPPPFPTPFHPCRARPPPYSRVFLCGSVTQGLIRAAWVTGIGAVHCSLVGSSLGIQLMTMAAPPQNPVTPIVQRGEVAPHESLLPTHDWLIEATLATVGSRLQWLSFPEDSSLRPSFLSSDSHVPSSPSFVIFPES